MPEHEPIHYYCVMFRALSLLSRSLALSCSLFSVFHFAFLFCVCSPSVHSLYTLCTKLGSSKRSLKLNNFQLKWLVLILWNQMYKKPQKKINKPNRPAPAPDLEQTYHTEMKYPQSIIEYDANICESETDNTHSPLTKIACKICYFSSASFLLGCNIHINV